MVLIMNKKIMIINGPNLNMLGYRNPVFYDNTSWKDYIFSIRSKFCNQIQILDFQSNHEGDIIDKIQEIFFDKDYIGLIINAGGYSHTSIAIHDALEILEIPIIEVHLSNIHKREEFRNHSYITELAKKCIMGEGLKGYELGIQYLLDNYGNKI